MTDYEDRARASKAYRLARVWYRDILPENRRLAREAGTAPLLLRTVAEAGPAVRRRVAALAGVSGPSRPEDRAKGVSDETWQAMVGILARMERDRVPRGT